MKNNNCLLGEKLCQYQFNFMHGKVLTNTISGKRKYIKNKHVVTTTIQQKYKTQKTQLRNV